MTQSNGKFDQTKLEELQGKMLGDTSGSMALILAFIGDRLDLYSALSEFESATSVQLAESTGLEERYIREWLSSNAAAEYVTYDGATKTYSITPEQKVAFALLFD